MSRTELKAALSTTASVRSRDRDKALIFGLAYRRQKSTVSPIPTTISDAEDMREFLLEQGFLACNIVMITDECKSRKQIPSRKNMLREMRKFMKGMQSGDRRVFFYAGHGCQIVCEHKTEPDGLEEAILAAGNHGPPCDKNGKPLKPSEVSNFGKTHPHKKALRGIITDNELRRELVYKVPPRGRLIAIFDTCHSGTILDLPYHWQWQNSRFVTVFNKPNPKLPGEKPKARTVTIASLARKNECRRAEDGVASLCSSYISDGPFCDEPDSDESAFGELAEVYSLSSAQDNQNTWGKENATMTKTLLKILRGKQEPPIMCEVMKALNEGLERRRQASLTQGLIDGRVPPLRSQSCEIKVRKRVKTLQCPQFGSLSAMARYKKLSF